MHSSTYTTLSVLLIDPFIVRSGRLMDSLGAEPSISLLGCAKNLREAYNITEAQQPDLVIVDDRQTELMSFATYAAMLDIIGSACIVLADNGCAPVVQTASMTRLSSPEIEAAGGLGPWLVRRYGLPTPAARRAQPATVTAAPALRHRGPPVAAPKARHARLPLTRTRWKTVVIGASTGGIEAILSVLSAFEADCPPTLIVQHIGGDFVPGLVSRLDRHCAARVEVATASSDIRAGLVLVAPGGDSHLSIVPPGRRCRLVAGPPVSGHRPSVDVLFQSASKLGSDVVGTILTGMGRDGAEGLAAIRAGGGWTIGQDEASSTVYGMPRAAYQLGAVAQQLPLSKIGPAILRAAAPARQEAVHDRR